MIPIRLQLQWVTQSQFAGYYAALDQGFYADEGLDVTILEGAVEIVPQQVVAAGDAEFGIAWVPKMLASREQGADLVNIAQVFQRSGTLEISWADSGIAEPADWAGKRVGTWGFGNEFELFAALRQAGIEPDDPAQVEIVQQPFDMSLLLNRDIDAAEAMIYNEYAQVLEATNPDTGELYKPEDLNVINFNDVGTAMLQDHIFARESWLAEAGNEDIAVKFLRASFKGWIFCRDNFDACVEHVLDAGTTLGPMANVRFARTVRAQVAEAVAAGATALIDAADFPEDDGGAYLAPQILVNVDHSMRVMKEESFGPVVGIMKVSSDAEAIALMNDSPYGLTCSLWTADPEAAAEIGAQLETGTIYMNRCDYLDPALCWTGCKDTGRGAALGPLGFYSVTRPKSYHLKKVTK